MADDTGRGPQLVEMMVGDDPASWARAGFRIADGAVVVAGITVRLVGERDGGRGIREWAVAADGPDDIDGLATRPATPPAARGPAIVHANGVVGLDHLVVVTPDSDRTTSALAAAGFPRRGVRRFETSEGRRRQTFFWAGDTIVELVGADEPTGDGPATFWGLAFVTADLEATVAELQGIVSEPRDAVQPGRRIASLRHRDVGISIPIAFMTPHR